MKTFPYARIGGRSRRWFLAGMAAVLVAGCASLRSDYEPPAVMLDSFRLLPSEGLAPRFALGLRVVNPNPAPLPLTGLSYDVALAGQRLITGVARDLKTVPAFGESTVELQAGVDLISGVLLFQQILATSPSDEIDYRLRARLSTGGLTRLLTLEESGTLSLANWRR
ncbi:LEA type 2 family protein [Thioalkalicoccus limnaeus]|uniref:LEA type 2 family protein n=1 Tax=Thioalkalicoccus limnaeus TaxID=120681 RepID=A0ABV4BNA0_9GAMM